MTRTIPRALAREAIIESTMAETGLSKIKIERALLELSAVGLIKFSSETMAVKMVG